MQPLGAELARQMIGPLREVSTPQKGWAPWVKTVHRAQDLICRNQGYLQHPFLALCGPTAPCVTEGLKP